MGQNPKTVLHRFWQTNQECDRVASLSPNPINRSLDQARLRPKKEIR
ncbi:MAG: hypothetical protein F6J90_12795 [Moorea sp. SIOASIH]|nr:hypothetical protein [Moorena sp. SIOASIH]